MRATSVDISSSTFPACTVHKPNIHLPADKTKMKRKGKTKVRKWCSKKSTWIYRDKCLVDMGRTLLAFVTQKTHIMELSDMDLNTTVFNLLKEIKDNWTIKHNQMQTP